LDVGNERMLLGRFNFSGRVECFLCLRNQINDGA
jgi:hypothetical protein